MLLPCLLDSLGPFQASKRRCTSFMRPSSGSRRASQEKSLAFRSRDLLQVLQSGALHLHLRLPRLPLSVDLRAERFTCRPRLSILKQKTFLKETPMKSY